MVLACGEYGGLVLVLPAVDESLFAFQSMDHERGRPIGVNGVATLFCQQGDLLLIGAHDGFEFVARTLADIGEQGKDANSLRKQPNEFFKRARAKGWVDDAGDASPRGKCHGSSPGCFAVRLTVGEVSGCELPRLVVRWTSDEGFDILCRHGF